jgi:hypothetical protein
MLSTGMTLKAIGLQMGYHYAVSEKTPKPT